MKITSYVHFSFKIFNFNLEYKYKIKCKNILFFISLKWFMCKIKKLNRYKFYIYI